MVDQIYKSGEIIEKVISNIINSLRKELKKVEHELIETDGNRFSIDIIGNKLITLIVNVNTYEYMGLLTAKQEKIREQTLFSALQNHSKQTLKSMDREIDDMKIN